MAEHRLKPYLALIVVQVSFASLAIVGKLAVGHLPPIVVAGIRMFFATLVLGGLAFALRQRPSPRHLAALFGLSILGIVLNQILFLEGLQRTTAINAAILVATIPIFTTGLEILVGREAPQPIRLIGIGVAMAGALVLLGIESFDVGSDHQLGNLLVVLNCLSYSFYLVLSRPMLDQYRSVTVVAWTFLFGALLITPFAAIRASTVDVGAVPTAVWWALAWIIIFPSILSYALNNYALKRIRASTVATYVFLQPLIGVVLALLLWRPFGLAQEALQVRTILGGILILAGLIVVSRAERVEPLPVIAQSGEAMSRQPIDAPDGRAQPEPQEDH